MRRLGSSLIAASLLLGSMEVLAKPNQEVNTNSSQANPLEHPSPCESVRITLVDGRKIETASYRHRGDHVEITKKGAVQTILASDIKLIEVRQGSCPDIVVTLKTGESPSLPAGPRYHAQERRESRGLRMGPEFLRSL